MIKNQELANQILEIMNTGIEASEELMVFLKNDQMQEFFEVSEVLRQMIQSVCRIAEGLKEVEPSLNLPAASESVFVSLNRIREYANTDVARAYHKIEFELIPLVEEMRANFFYWGTVYPDLAKMKKYNEEDIYWLSRNKYVEMAEQTGKYKYDLSISVLAYNKIEYTKQCLMELYKNLPKDITYEIILINHGSSDRTKELFEAFRPNKQLDIAVNGGGFAAINRIVEGKYWLGISNDVIVTKNAIDNLYTCISSNEKIGWVVPTTPNVSNCQSISADYADMEELQRFAEKNNISNPNRWEQRTRLCDPIAIWRSIAVNQIKLHGRYLSGNEQSFPDDKAALFLRRAGYKMYLAKDAFCHHFGSVTLREEKQTMSQEAYIKGRRLFADTFGIDPWSTGFCYSPSLFEKLVCDKIGQVNILGINCGMGSNSLKIKEELKEKVSNYTVSLKNITTNPAYLEDLQGVSDEAVYMADYHSLQKCEEEYDYVIIEEMNYTEDSVKEDIALFAKLSKKDGQVIVLLTDNLISKIGQDGLETNECKVQNIVPHGDGRYWVIFQNNKK